MPPPPPPRDRAKLPAVTTAPATTPAPVALKDRPPRRKPPQLPPSNAAALAALRAGDKKPPADPSRKESQDKVGNGAVAAGLARSPATDPKFAVLKKDVAHKKHTVARSHPPAGKEATSAQDASVPPKDDEVAQGKTANAEKMNEAKPKEFDKEAFVKAVEQAIAEKAPKNLEQADEFADSDKPAEIKAEVQGKVGEGKSDSAEQIADTTAAPPDTSAAETKQVVPMAADRPPGTPATPDPAKATPDKLPPSATDLSAGPAGVNREMAENQVTEQQLQKSNEPAFGSALKEKKTAEKHSETTPPELRKNEAQQLRQTTAQAKGLGAAAMGAIAGRRVRTGRQVGGGKQATKATDEEKRAQVTATLQKVFDTMKTEVEGILTGLDKLVDDQFTKGEKEARDAFTAEHRQKMDEYKDRRYSGPLGALRWGKDKLFGLPPEADLIFVVARDHYVKRMRGVISAVADTIGRELTRAKQRIAKGRDELQAEVKKLPKDLQALGKQAAAEFADKFDELTQSVDDKSTELVDTLATKYTDAVKAVDDEIAAEKEKNKGLVDKAMDAVKGVIKTIMELKDLLLGVLAKAAQAVMGILRDPIGFLGNLVSAVGGGLKLFMHNAGRHLQQGVLSWLLGTAATAGITLPTSFDVMGILLLIASLIGLSWANLRARLARKLPKEAMTAIEVGEHALPIVLEVRKRGIRALWGDLKARVGDLKKNLIDNLVSYLLPTIIIAGVTWIISLFNPASAFIRACKMIIDIIRFIVTNGKQIIEFVNTVLDAVIAIAKGGSGGVPALVEKALARSIPVLIGALAALLGIGGIAGKVKEIFQKLARPVNKAIDWVVDKIVGLAKKVWAKVKALAKKLKDKAKAAGQKVKDKFGKKKPEKDKKKARGGSKKPGYPNKKAALDDALREAKQLIGDESATVESVQKHLPALKRKYRLTSIRLVKKSGDRYHISLAINPRADTQEEILGFHYKLKDASQATKMTPVSGTFRRLHKVIKPSKDKHRAGFVISITAIPGDVKPAIASRFLTEAWTGSSEQPVAAIRTAVIIGVNSFEPLDPGSADSTKFGKNAVIQALGRIERPESLLMATFGFVWEPRWVNIKNGKEVGQSVVRRVYRGLKDPAEKEAALQEEAKMRKAVPFGLIRSKVFNSSYTHSAVRILSEVNKTVHSLTQDADSGVMSPEGRGVLAAYDEILRTIRGDPTMIIGGYDFDRFEWGGHAGSHTEQLTRLSSQIDMAIRKAIAARHPEMLYPTEPSTLVKLWDEDLENGVFQVLQNRADAAALREMPPYGVGGAEGRRHRKWLQRLFGSDFSVIFDPRAAVSTDPRVTDFDRGLAVTPRHVEELVTRVTFPRLLGRANRTAERENLRRSHAAYAVVMQSQSMASAYRLALELVQANPGLKRAEQATLQGEIFVHVEEVVRLMVADPDLTFRDPVIQRRLSRMRAAVRRYRATSRAQGNQRIQDAMVMARHLSRDIVKALTAPELKETWRQLQRLLHEMERQSGPSGARSGGQR